MDFLNAIRSLSSEQATKRPSFSGGYIYRMDRTKTASDTWDEKYALRFIPHAAPLPDTLPTGYEFEVTRTGNDYVVSLPSSGSPFDAQMVASIFFATDWVIGSLSDFETARTASHTW